MGQRTQREDGGADAFRGRLRRGAIVDLLPRIPVVAEPAHDDRGARQHAAISSYGRPSRVRADVVQLAARVRARAAAAPCTTVVCPGTVLVRRGAGPPRLSP